MIIWRLTYDTCDEVSTQHFLSRGAAEAVMAEIPDTQEPKIDGIYVDRSNGFGSKARAVRWFNQQALQTARPQT